MAVCVRDVGQYLNDHADGVSRHVRVSEIPADFRQAFKGAQKEFFPEDGLESERVVDMYLKTQFGKPPRGSGFVQKIARQYWKNSPLAVVEKWLRGHGSVLELGCSVGRLGHVSDSYLGIDISFSSIWHARDQFLRSRKQKRTGPNGQQVDFVVAEIEVIPVREKFDVCVALNIIDMMETPSALARIQKAHLKTGGLAVQSSPYAWREDIAARNNKESVLKSYLRAGFKIQKERDGVPWVFYKNERQLELYSVHLFQTALLDC